MKTSTKFVVAAVVFVTLFEAAAFAVLWRTGMNIDPAITAGHFSFWTVEIIALASIKNNKTKKTQKPEKPKKKKQEETENVG